jgi:hypothetical protein
MGVKDVKTLFIRKLRFDIILEGKKE